MAVRVIFRKYLIEISAKSEVLLLDIFPWILVFEVCAVATWSKLMVCKMLSEFSLTSSY